MTNEIPGGPLDDSDESVGDAYNPPSTPPKLKPRRRVMVEWIVVIVVAVLASVVVRTFVFQTYFIPSASMEPTLMVGDRIIVNKLSVDFGTINIGDIVVFKAPPAEHCGDVVTDLVKRVIGVPGDYLTSKGNTIYVGRSPTTEKPLVEAWTHNEPLGPPPIGNVHVAANHYFMMGDWHSNSCDSRMWGTVPKSDIIGKVYLGIWPLSRIRWI